MATDNEMITTKTVVELDEKTAPVDADLFMAGDAGTAALKKFKWSNLLAAIKTKLAAWTFSTLTTNNKTLPGAMNELNSQIAYMPVSRRAVFFEIVEPYGAILCRFTKNNRNHCQSALNRGKHFRLGLKFDRECCSHG